jgi:hypothetical protein
MKFLLGLAAALAAFASIPARADDAHYWIRHEGPAYAYPAEPGDSPDKLTWVVTVPLKPDVEHDPNFSTYLVMRDAKTLPDPNGIYRYCTAVTGKTVACTEMNARTHAFGDTTGDKPLVPQSTAWKIVEDISKNRMQPMTAADVDRLSQQK